MACGCPCVTGSYAGGAALVDPGMLVDPVAFYYEGSYAVAGRYMMPLIGQRKAEEWLGKRASLDPQYDWINNWPRFEKWFREDMD